MTDTNQQEQALDDYGYPPRPDSRNRLRKIGIRGSKTLLVKCIYACMCIAGALLWLIIATTLILLRTVDEQKAIKGMPWSVILMVTGVTVLIAMLEKTKGLELFTSGIQHLDSVPL